MSRQHQPAEWAAKYIGIPFEDGKSSFQAADCWGLFELVYRVELGIKLPSYERYVYGKGERIHEISLYMHEQAAKDPWVEIPKEDAKQFDGMLLRMRGMPTHVSVNVGAHHMLHTERGIQAMCEDYTGNLWENRVIAVYRHMDMM